MKLISLNTWGGRAGREEILEFFSAYSDVDIFCLQEMWDGGHHMAGTITGGMRLENIVYELMTDIGSILTEHTPYFRPHFYDWYGLAMFIRKDLEVVQEGDVFVYKEKGFALEDDLGNHARNIQYLTIKTGSSVKTIINFHGLWNGQGKTDTSDRLVQSENIIRFLEDLSHPYILVGDFNLLPNTESIKKFEAIGLRNLIKEFGVDSTRSKHYTKPEKFADYAFVSNGIIVNDFKVLDIHVSDHLPLLLDFA